MELVEATRSDVDELAEFWFALASGMEQYSAVNELAVEQPADAREGFEQQLDREDTTVFLIQAEGTSVGYLMLREGTRPSREHSEYATIVDLFVEAAYRGNGHGSDSIEAAKDIASDRGCAYLTVSCEWDNDGARRLYERNGFDEKQVTYAQRLDPEN